MMATRRRGDRLPPYMFYTCPGCNKQGAAMFTLDSLPLDWDCSSCGMPSHLWRDGERVILSFDHPDWVQVDTLEGAS
jgi:hypothetical protein